MEVMSQPTTTIANGFCNSAPVPVLDIIGNNHITEVKAVISTGLSLTIAQCTTDTCIHSFVIMVPLKSSFFKVFSSISGSQNFSLKAFSKYKIITTHVSTAFQKSDINQTETATEKLNQDINNAMTHHTKLNGILEATIETSHTSLYAKKSINNMIKITVGTTIFKVFFALNWFSYCHVHST
jgi:hypothetical protein